MYSVSASKRPWIVAICALFFCWSIWYRDVAYRAAFNEYAVSSDGDGRQNSLLANQQAENVTLQKDNATALPPNHPSNERPLILYAYSESDEARINIQYFIDHGLHDAADFIFILNGETDIDKVIPEKGNIHHIHRPNDCYDLGSYAEILTKNDLYKKYSKFIMLNASLRGPFLPAWAQSCWSSLYLARITATTKLIGMTANCHPEFHIQSMIWATDSIGIEILLFPSKDVLARLPPQPMYDFKGVYNKSENLTPGINNCFHNMPGAINAEIGATALMRTAGYGVEAVMSAFRGIGDEVDKDSKTDPNSSPALQSNSSSESSEKQDQPIDLASDYEKFCNSSGAGDLLFEGAYFGTNVHPFETIFMKTNRGIGEVALEKLTSWMKGSKFSSYDYCKL